MFYYEDIRGNHDNEYSKIIFIPVQATHCTTSLVEWAKRNILQKTDLIYLYHVREPLRNRLKTIKDLETNFRKHAEKIFLEYRQISHNLLDIVAMQLFQDDFRNVLKLSFCSNGNDDFFCRKMWDFGNLDLRKPILGIIHEKMIQSLSCKLLLDPCFRYVFVCDEVYETDETKIKMG